MLNLSFCLSEIYKRETNAYDDLQRSNKGWCAKLRLKGEIAAYNDVLSLIEKSKILNKRH